jgi:hypothetical protein
MEIRILVLFMDCLVLTIPQDDVVVAVATAVGIVRKAK